VPDQTVDWVAWHRSYDDPDSSQARRLARVQEHLRRAIDDKPGPLRLVSMCAGEARDVVGVLSDHPRRNDVSARLVELDARNVGVARSAIDAAGLDQIEVVQADAGTTDSYLDAVPADIVLACGIFGNISDEDVRWTVEHLPSLCASNAVVIWTRGRLQGRDVAHTIREWFADAGFEELAFEVPAEAQYWYRVGVHRLWAGPRPLELGVRLFTFLR